MLRILLTLFLFAASLDAAERKPNIIFLLADDLGYGEVGAFGQKLARTPNLDRLAAEGTRFTSFYAGSTVCAPSRSVLVTGRHTGHTRVRGNAGPNNREAQILRAEDVTVAEVLKKAGYSTALVGKWGLGEEKTEGEPNKKGFDYFYGYLDQLHAHNPYPEFIIRNGERVSLRNKLLPGSAGARNVGEGVAAEPLDYVPDLMALEALKWVREQKDKPFFLYWSLISPHANNEGTKLGRGQEVPELGEYATRDWPKPDQAHAAAITRLDADLGRMLALLKELGIDEHTLILFSSDNGPHREGGNNPALFQSSGALRGIKRDLTDGGIRVPTIARWPGRIPAGSADPATLWFADVLPTLAHLAGAENHLPAGLDGISFAEGLLTGKAPRSPRNLYWEFHENGFSQAVLMESRWKAIRKRAVDAPIAIYDLEKDIAEEKDLAQERADLVEKAKALFESARTDSPDWPIRKPAPRQQQAK